MVTGFTVQANILNQTAAERRHVNPGECQHMQSECVLCVCLSANSTHNRHIFYLCSALRGHSGKQSITSHQQRLQLLNTLWNLCEQRWPWTSSSCNTTLSTVLTHCRNKWRFVLTHTHIYAHSTQQSDKVTIGLRQIDVFGQLQQLAIKIDWQCRVMCISQCQLSTKLYSLYSQRKGGTHEDEWRLGCLGWRWSLICSSV